jgi:hypothetical protein
VILIVEDEFLGGEHLRHILESAGHGAISTADADEDGEVGRYSFECVSKIKTAPTTPERTQAQLVRLR